MAKPNLDRRETLGVLFPDPSRYLFVSGLAGSAKDAAALTDDGDNLFTMAGAMGAAASFGLGMALSAPDREVCVITGDGELLMNVGSLATIATMRPKNLSVVVMDNSSHGETGGQAGHTAVGTDLAMMGRGAGLASTMTVSEPNELEDAARFLSEAEGPRLLVLRVKEGPPAAYARNMDPAHCRTRFRNAFLGTR